MRVPSGFIFNWQPPREAHVIAERQHTFRCKCGQEVKTISKIKLRVGRCNTCQAEANREACRRAARKQAAKNRLQKAKARELRGNQ